ncbi:MAG: hydrogenase maturation protease [Armatimonadetes bacterium]|nr:hydrogenase maturation protease [Armatimonadota bacterium]MDW8122389.1 hydrogenase maturation protease [Armatimonadota bacterium]
MKGMDQTQVQSLLDLLRDRNFVIVGVGNPMRGDDGVGSLIAGQLSQFHPDRVFDAGAVPENFLGPILNKRPSVCLFVDAVDFGGQPGDWQLVSLSDLEDKLPTTHTLSLSLLGQLLEEADIQCWVLAIQPQQIAFGAPLSNPVNKVKNEVIHLLKGILDDQGQMQETKKNGNHQFQEKERTEEGKKEGEQR